MWSILISIFVISQVHDYLVLCELEKTKRAKLENNKGKTDE